jgi:nucleoside-diphosphate-sugar epimerase
VYGPWALGGGGVGTTAMEDLLRTAMRGETVEIDPTPREWLYSKDAARAVHFASWNDQASSGVFNVSEGITNSGDDLAQAISALFPDAAVNVGGASITAAIPSMTMPVMDTTRARELLGFATEFTVGKAFADYYEWLKHAPSQTSA